LLPGTVIKNKIETHNQCFGSLPTGLRYSGSRSDLGKFRSISRSDPDPNQNPVVDPDPKLLAWSDPDPDLDSEQPFRSIAYIGTDSFDVIICVHIFHL
jgi:hypothetical protein